MNEHLDDYELARQAEQGIDPSAFESSQSVRLRLFLYLIPVFGAWLAFWKLQTTRRQDWHRREQNLSRLSVVLALSWLLATALLIGSSNFTEFSGLTLKLMAGSLTSGYFLSCFWLMLQLWRRQRPWLPGLSNLSDRLP